MLRGFDIFTIGKKVSAYYFSWYAFAFPKSIRNSIPREGKEVFSEVGRVERPYFHMFVF